LLYTGERCNSYTPAVTGRLEEPRLLFFESGAEQTVLRQGIFLKNIIKMMEPGSLQWYLMGDNRYKLKKTKKRFRLSIKKVFVTMTAK